MRLGWFLFGWLVGRHYRPAFWHITAFVIGVCVLCIPFNAAPEAGKGIFTMLCVTAAYYVIKWALRTLFARVRALFP